jgi:hypothetical protein
MTRASKNVYYTIALLLFSFVLFISTCPVFFTLAPRSVIGALSRVGNLFVL